MKIISVRQPWAWLIVQGYKDVENRTWATGYRGHLLIHAGKKIDQEAIDWVDKWFKHITFPAQFDTGGIVGRAILANCVT